MSIDTIHKVILYPFIKESIASLSAMTKLQGNAGDAFEDNVDDFRFKGCAICSQIQGELEGVILMHHYEETALEIGAQVYNGLAGKKAADTSNMNQDLSDALAEWGNTIVGRATDMLAKHNLGFSFSAPEMVLDLDDMEKFLKDVVTIVTVPIHVDGVGRYFFNLLIRKANANTDTLIVSADGEALSRIKSLDNPLEKDANILLVDDSPLIRKALRRYLGKIGYNNISEAGDGNEAIEIITNGSPPSFVFMDIVMDKMNGDDALATIRESKIDVPVVMLTSVTDSNVIDKCTSFDIQGFVLKPLKAETASDVLSHCLGCI